MTAVLSALVSVAIIIAAYLAARHLIPRSKYRYVGHRQMPGWKGALPFYEFRCKVHGLVESYPAGYGQVLRCPLCQDLDRYC